MEWYYNLMNLLFGWCNSYEMFFIAIFTYMFLLLGIGEFIGKVALKLLGIKIED